MHTVVRARAAIAIRVELIKIEAKSSIKLVVALLSCEPLSDDVILLYVIPAQYSIAIVLYYSYLGVQAVVIVQYCRGSVLYPYPTHTVSAI
jgi:hypothetical protein